MRDLISEAIEDAAHAPGVISGDGIIDPEAFEQLLIDYGFMIVPIEDPTNLRYGVEADGLAD